MRSRSADWMPEKGLGNRPPVYPLVLLSILATTMLGARIHVGESTTHVYLAFNLVLAWIPYLLSLAAFTFWSPRRWILESVLGVCWLAFFPNAAYLVTDLVHLAPRGVPLWYDVLLLATFAVSGLFIAMCSLRTMQSIWDAQFGRFGGWLLTLGAIALNAVGIYLGRFERWNSWDLATRPDRVLADAMAAVDAKRFVVFSALYAAFVLVAYVAFLSASPQRTTCQETRTM